MQSCRMQQEDEVPAQKNHGNASVFVWAYKIKCTCPSLPAKSQKKLNLPKTLLAKLQLFLLRRYYNCLDAANFHSRTLRPNSNLSFL